MGENQNKDSWSYNRPHCRGKNLKAPKRGCKFLPLYVREIKVPKFTNLGFFGLKPYLKTPKAQFFWNK